MLCTLTGRLPVAGPHPVAVRHPFYGGQQRWVDRETDTVRQLTTLHRLRGGADEAVESTAGRERTRQHVIGEQQWFAVHITDHTWLSRRDRPQQGHVQWVVALVLRWRPIPARGRTNRQQQVERHEPGGAARLRGAVHIHQQWIDPGAGYCQTLR